MNIFTREHIEDCQNLCVKMLPGHCCCNTKLAVQQQELHMECNNEQLGVLVEELVMPDCKLQFKTGLSVKMLTKNLQVLVHAN